MNLRKGLENSPGLKQDEGQNIAYTELLIAISKRVRSSVSSSMWATFADKVRVFDLSGDTFLVNREEVEHAEDVVVLLPYVIALRRIPLVTDQLVYEIGSMLNQ